MTISLKKYESLVRDDNSNSICGYPLNLSHFWREILALLIKGVATGFKKLYPL